MLINAIHHFEILTKSSKNILNYFINGLNFKLIAINSTNKTTQHVIKSKNANFIITSLNNKSTNLDNKLNHVSDYDTINYLENSNSNLFNKILNRNDSVFNIALQVKSIDYIVDNCLKYNVEVIKKKSKINDISGSGNGSGGYINYAIINSCVDGVVHTLIEKDNYNQKLFLPNIRLMDYVESEDNVKKSEDLITTHFDHLTYATYKNTSNTIIDWYKNIFNMRRFYISNNKNEDFIVKTGNSGMNLKAINYWFCAESGIYLDNEVNQKNDFKFIIAEPLNENADNQISIFLNENNGPGIQHIGLYTPNIMKSVETSKVNNTEAKYYVPPDAYYSDEDKKIECKKSGHNIDDLKRNHILIDVEGDDNDLNVEKNDNKIEKYHDDNKNKYLLQVFTRPLFDKNTFFLEFIQRVNGAFGFGSGNIRALWNAVHLTLVNRKN